MYTKRVGRSKNDDPFLKIDEGDQFGQVFKFDPRAKRELMEKLIDVGKWDHKSSSS